jgi:hypothetical protein
LHWAIKKSEIDVNFALATVLTVMNKAVLLTSIVCYVLYAKNMLANPVAETTVVESHAELKIPDLKKNNDLPAFNPPDHYIVSQPPIQKVLASNEAIFKNGYQLMLRDYFEVQGRVLSRRIYIGDARADISPIDVALGWGKMSDVSFLQQVEFIQNNRFLYWHVNEFPMPRKELEASASNMHLIPEDERIERQLKSIKKGQIVTLYGYLVDVKAPDDFIWMTSRSRDDSGDGACEIIYVKGVKIRD